MYSDSPRPSSASDLQTLLHAAVAQRAAHRGQNFLLGFLAGFMALLAGTGCWVALASAVQGHCSFLALGVASLVGTAIRYFGRGVQWSFSGVGALLVAVGCALGTLFSACQALAQSRSAEFWLTVSSLRPASALALVQQQTDVLDAVFFGLAVGLGWVLARRSAA